MATNSSYISKIRIKKSGLIRSKKLRMDENVEKEKHARKYWNKNLKYLFILLLIWFACSFGAGIIWKTELDQFRIFGFKLGFWFAQQGSIYIFCILIFVYVYLMNKLDKDFGFDEE